MHAFVTRIGIQNSRSTPRAVYVEPWGPDYTLMPEERLEIFAYGDTAMPWFHIVESEDGVQVYCEETAIFKVMQGDRELECGHQRLT